MKKQKTVVKQMIPPLAFRWLLFKRMMQLAFQMLIGDLIIRSECKGLELVFKYHLALSHPKEKEEVG